MVAHRRARMPQVSGSVLARATVTLSIAFAVFSIYVAMRVLLNSSPLRKESMLFPLESARPDPTNISHLFHYFTDMNALNIVLTQFFKSTERQRQVQISISASNEFLNDAREACTKWGRCQIHSDWDAAEGEWPTLQQLYSFCQLHPFKSVAFNGRGNATTHERGRSVELLLSGQCSTMSSAQCNVCGSTFRPFHQPAFCGNAWIASCNYVRRLLSPSAFRNKSCSFAQQLLNRTDYVIFNMPGSPNDNLGIEDVQHWLVLHPDFRPCDVAIHDGQGQLQPAVLAPAPRYAIDHDNAAYYFSNQNQALAILDDEPFRRREYSLLPGILYRMHSLYGATPDETSWMWQWFPDGAFWRARAFSQEGIQAHLDRPFDDAELAIPNKTYSLNGYKGTDLRMSKSRFVFFYHIYMPLHLGEDGIQNSLRIVNDQLDQIRDSIAGASAYPKVDIFYTTVGDKVLTEEEMKRLCLKRHLSCRRLQHVAKGFEELTLQHLYDYCRSNENARVGYIHNKGSLHQGRNDLRRRYMTAAVASMLCVQPTNATCNVCGLHFRAVWVPFFPGNFWTASCAYVRKLRAPKDYMVQVYNVAMRLRYRISVAQLRSSVYPVEDDKLGTGRFSAEHWIGSHPALVPCDVTNDMHVLFHRAESLTPADYTFGMAPRHKVTDPWLHTTTRKRKLHDMFRSSLLRFTELSLLAGQTFKWQLLYNEKPSSDSWFWKWFPDGDFWRNATARYGLGASDAMIRLAIT